MGILRSVKNNKYANWIWLILLLLLPIVLWFLPSDFFDSSEVMVCPTKAFFNFECFGCGMTRAVMHFHHFEFEDAAYFNKFVFLVYPILVLIWFIWSRAAAKQLGVWPLSTKN